ncbi:MAG: ABC transporter permease [Anaerolineales bacterium]|nr:MAG: ABC transporter permease [Anaerolineales bacterium]
MWDTIFSQVFLVGLLAAGIRIATPLLLAALGEVISEKAGILNIGIEGLMLAGSLSAFLATYYSGNIWIGVLVGGLMGSVISLIHAYLSVTLGTDQVVSGIAINTFSIGLTSLVFGAIFGVSARPPSVQPLKVIPIKILADIPILGPILFQQTPIVYIAFALVPLVSWFLFKTDLGLSLRAVGESPSAAESAGINVKRFRYAAILVGGLLAGWGGAFLSVGQLGSFSNGMTAGRGFIALAAVIFGRWTPIGTLLASLVFGTAYALQLSLQALGFSLPPQVLLMMPYIITMVALLGSVGRHGAPAALAVPYKRE